MDPIAKFTFGLKILKLCLQIIKYKTDLMCSLYKIFKKAKIYLDIPNTKAQIQKKFKLKFDYKAFKSFQGIIAAE